MASLGMRRASKIHSRGDIHSDAGLVNERHISESAEELTTGNAQGVTGGHRRNVKMMLNNRGQMTGSRQINRSIGLP